MKAYYCVPSNCGLASETGSVCRRLAKLIKSLDDHINGFVVDGAILEDIRNFRMELGRKLEAEGWTFSYQGGEKLSVRAPGHKKPFPKRS